MADRLPGDAARVAERIASMLSSGVAAHRAFSVLAGEDGADPEIIRVAAEVAEGGAIADALAAGPGPEWRVFGAAWDLAEESGAPLAASLERIAQTLGRLAEVDQRRTVLLSGPIATIRTVVALPPLSLALGWLLGFDPFRVFLGPWGWLLLVSGISFLLAGSGWGRGLVRRAVGSRAVSGLEFDLAEIALGGGAGTSVLRRRIVDAVDRVGAEWIRFDDLTDCSPLVQCLGSAGATGAPISDLLAGESRRRVAASLSEMERACERLGVRILLPICACILPAFVVIGVVPVVISMLAGY